MIQNSNQLRKNLNDNTIYFRKEIQNIGFTIKSGVHPIIPIMIEDAKLSKMFADSMLNQGIYVVSFSYPVVPKGEARIRVQLSAAHTQKQLNYALENFQKVGKKLNII